MTPMEIGGAIQSAKTLLDLTKGIASVVKRINDSAIKAELNEKIIDVQQQVMGLQAVIIQLRDENALLRGEISAAVNLEAFKARYRYEESVCWKYDEVGQRIDGPFCPNCIDEHIERRLNPLVVRGTFTCTHHEHDFRTNEYRPEGGPPRYIR